MNDAHILVETGDFFVHRIRVGRIAAYRGEYCRQFAAGHEVLGIGRVDPPIFNPHSNLHLLLEPVCEVDGLDTDVAGLAELAKYGRGRLFSDFSEVTDAYDLVLVPELIEHVANYAEFLAALDRAAFGEVVVTVRCACNAQRHHGFQYDESQGLYQEFAHLAHRVWYSPCTLYTTQVVHGLVHQGHPLLRAAFGCGALLQATLMRARLHGTRNRCPTGRPATLFKECP